MPFSDPNISSLLKPKSLKSLHLASNNLNIACTLVQENVKLLLVLICFILRIITEDINVLSRTGLTVSCCCDLDGVKGKISGPPL